VTVTVVVPLDAVKALVAVYAAVMVLLPATRALPATVKVAVALEPDAVRVPVPSDFEPSVKVTVPVGAVVPLAGLTVAVRTVLAVELMLAGFAETVVVVPTAGTVTVTVVFPLDAVKAVVAP
jgi:hypothetical protein